jgi:calcineurin-like phosphoesterase family protein
MIKTDFVTKIENPDKVFITSDTHFWHVNAIKYCARPWDTVEEMNQALVDNWNSVVGKDDHIYHLGDFSFGGIEKCNEFLQPGVLNGNIHLILGNHDTDRLLRDTVNYGRFCEITFQKILLIDGWTVFLNHFPFMDFSNNIDHKVAQLYGHTHENPFVAGTMIEEKVKFLKWNQYNIGVDNNDYRPISLARAMEIIKERRDKSIV